MASPPVLAVSESRDGVLEKRGGSGKVVAPENYAFAKLQGVVYDSDESGTAHRFDFYMTSDRLVLGRSGAAAPLDVINEGVDMGAGDSSKLSRKHADIAFNLEKEAFELSCTGRNGLTVTQNGLTSIMKQETPPCRLSSRALIQLGDCLFVFLLPIPRINLFAAVHWIKADHKAMQSLIMRFGYGRWDALRANSSRLSEKSNEELISVARRIIAKCCVYAKAGVEKKTLREILKEDLPDYMSSEDVARQIEKDLKEAESTTEPAERRKYLRWAKKLRLLRNLRESVNHSSLEKLRKGELTIHTPTPAAWWDSQDDYSLLVGIYRHGYGNTDAIREDPNLSFYANVGPAASSKAKQPDTVGTPAESEEEDEDDDAEEEEEKREEKNQEPPVADGLESAVKQEPDSLVRGRVPPDSTVLSMKKKEEKLNDEHPKAGDEKKTEDKEMKKKVESEPFLPKKVEPEMQIKQEAESKQAVTEVKVEDAKEPVMDTEKDIDDSQAKSLSNDQENIATTPAKEKKHTPSATDDPDASNSVPDSSQPASQSEHQDNSSHTFPSQEALMRRLKSVINACMKEVERDQRELSKIKEHEAKVRLREEARLDAAAAKQERVAARVREKEERRLNRMQPFSKRDAAEFVRSLVDLGITYKGENQIDWEWFLQRVEGLRHKYPETLEEAYKSCVQECHHLLEMRDREAMSDEDDEEPPPRDTIFVNNLERAEKVLERLEFFKYLRTVVLDYPTLNQTLRGVKRPKELPEWWRHMQDRALLHGVNKYGLNNWEAVASDSELGFEIAVKQYARKHEIKGLKMQFPKAAVCQRRVKKIIDHFRTRVGTASVVGEAPADTSIVVKPNRVRKEPGASQLSGEGILRLSSGGGTDANPAVPKKKKSKKLAAVDIPPVPYAASSDLTIHNFGVPAGSPGQVSFQGDREVVCLLGFTSLRRIEGKEYQFEIRSDFSDRSVHYSVRQIVKGESVEPCISAGSPSLAWEEMVAREEDLKNKFDSGEAAMGLLEPSVLDVLSRQWQVYKRSISNKDQVIELADGGESKDSEAMASRMDSNVEEEA